MASGFGRACEGRALAEIAAVASTSALVAESADDFEYVSIAPSVAGEAEPRARSALVETPAPAQTTVGARYSYAEVAAGPHSKLRLFQPSLM